MLKSTHKFKPKHSSSSAMHHVSSIKKGDYGVAVSKDLENPGKVSRPFVFRTLKLTDGGLIGRLVVDEHLKVKDVEIDLGSLVCNLGPSPQIDSAFGIDFKGLYQGSKEHEDFGEVHFFTKVDANLGKSLWSALSLSAKKLKPHGLTCMLDLPIVYEVVSRKSKYAGYFKMPKDVTKRPAQCELNVGYNNLAPKTEDLVYYTLHELGHAVEHFYLHDRHNLRSQWLDLYTTTTARQEPTDRQLKALKHVLLSIDSVTKVNAELVASFSDEAPDYSKLFSSVLRYMNKVRGVSRHELSLILKADLEKREERLDEIWPDAPALCAERKSRVLVTDYATTNVSELFAESFAYHLLGKDLPKQVSSLMDRSIQAALKAHKRRSFNQD